VLPKRILVATDFSRVSDLALQYAIELAKRARASIHVLHVIDMSRWAASPDGFFVGLADLELQMTHNAERRLAELQLEPAHRALPMTIQVASGAPAQRIVEEAVRRASDLIVMGTHGRRGVSHLLNGSVAERVVRSAPCPVLTVRDTRRLFDMFHRTTSDSAALSDLH
jgi:nucleotide-binding universal stress UspA family protein